MQKELTVTSKADRSSTKAELFDPIVNVPAGINTISWGQGLTLAAKAGGMMNKNAIVTPVANNNLKKLFPSFDILIAICIYISHNF
ncbi:MAG: hypothetical protein RMY62_006125 [Nostoc sp. ZfuVER08]|uniref:hypothetical protein n=1 Tax=Nostoc punctiforme TaxID=272131 RepID=UPI0018EF5398|nr:hypothetical protein [Nostoc punctiforme]